MIIHPYMSGALARQHQRDLRATTGASGIADGAVRRTASLLESAAQVLRPGRARTPLAHPSPVCCGA